MPTSMGRGPGYSRPANPALEPTALELTLSRRGSMRAFGGFKAVTPRRIFQ